MGKKKLIEKLAEIEHQRWSDWQAYLFSKSEWTKDGYLMPKELCKHWQRQIDTPYSKLSEREKESDRKEVMRYWPLIKDLKVKVYDLKRLVQFVYKVGWDTGVNGRKKDKEQVLKLLEEFKKKVKKIKENK